GGTDMVTVDDLGGTAVEHVSIDLGGADGAADHVILNATDGKDDIDVSGDASALEVNGLAATVELLHPESAVDSLEIETLDGADRVRTATVAAGAIRPLVDGAQVT